MEKKIKIEISILRYNFLNYKDIQKVVCFCIYTYLIYHIFVSYAITFDYKNEEMKFIVFYLKK